MVNESRTVICPPPLVLNNLLPNHNLFLSLSCGCDECVASSDQDSLRHSQARINAYRALSSSSLIALSSKDPILTAFELSWELRRLSRMETEFRNEYTVSPRGSMSEDEFT